MLIADEDGAHALALSSTARRAGFMAARAYNGYAGDDIKTLVVLEQTRGAEAPEVSRPSRAARRL
ncbi:MAG TPA: hypothetical protein VLJ61_03460 [Pyrinomonadaceae bacterium]|nr:hypothetical protein [Pyrinomonadaceae bacterium]